MDIERVNMVLVKAIIGFQEAEIEDMTEATVGGYKVPTPGQVAAKSKKSKCSHRNKKGDFATYNDCVAHMTKCKKMGEGDAQGLCGGVMFGGKRGKKKKSDDEG